MLAACGQNYSDKPAAEALAERNLTPLGGPAAATDPLRVAAAGAAAGAGQQLMGDLRLSLPEGWTSVQPSSSMRVAEYALPAGGGPGLSVAVFADIGGGAEANVRRWYGQFTQPDGRPTEGVAERSTVQTDGGLQAILVDVAGTFDGGMAMGGGPSQEGYRMLAAIVQTDRHVYHFKLVGPQADVAAGSEGFRQLVQSLRN